MSIKALQDYTVYSKYAHYLPEKKRREIWDEMVDRMFGMHERKFKNILDSNEEFKKDFYFAKDMVLKKRVLGSQRALQFGGRFIEKNNLKIYNCTFTHIDRVRAFQEAMYLLLYGAGVGFSVQRCHNDKLPDIRPRDKKEKGFQLEDSIEGWADAVGVLVSSYFDIRDEEFAEFSGHPVRFDFSKIRPVGSLIDNQFIAPGHQQLEKSLLLMGSVFETRLANGENRLHPIDSYDVNMHSSDAVLSGGVRRSSTICIFSADDQEMIEAKTGDWLHTNKQRSRSNNSVAILENENTKEVFSKVFDAIKSHGDPGFVFLPHEDAGYNPSLRKGTKVLTSNGIFPIDSLQDKDFQVRNLFGEWKDATCRLSGKNKSLYKLRLGNKWDYYCTEEHEWPTIYKHGFQKKKTKDLTTTDRIPRNYIGEIGRKEGVGDYSDGFLIGWLYGDGSITDRKNGKRQYSFIVSDKDAQNGNIDNIILNKLNSLIPNQPRKLNWSRRRDPKRNKYQELSTASSKIDGYFKSFLVDKKEYGLPKSLFDFKYSEEYRKGFIDGLFSSDGCVDTHKRSGFIGISSSREKLADDLIELLGFYGFFVGKHRFSSKANERTFPNGKTYGTKEYVSFRMKIYKAADIYHWKKFFKFTHTEKQTKLDNIQLQHDIYSPQTYINITSIEKTDLKEDVWDIGVFDDTHCFQLSHCVTGNCVEIGLWPKTKDGRSGVSFCNLSTTNGKKCKTPQDFYDACRASAFIGTLQASYTDFPYLRPESKEICGEESLLGCSITGIMDSPDILLNPDILKKGSQIVKDTNERIAKIIGINPAARMTAIKPEGTTSCALGSSSGIHPHHARRYFRRVQANNTEFPYQVFDNINPRAVETSFWKPETDKIITFLCEVPAGSITKNDLSAIELLKKVKLLKKYWVDQGVRPERCLHPDLRHNVSNTITVKPEEWAEVEKFLFNNRQFFSGVSLLPESGDKDYPQAPFTTVPSLAMYNREYGEAGLFASGLIVDGLAAFADDLWKACDCVLGEGERLHENMDEPDEPLKPKRNGYTIIEFNKKMASYSRKLEKYYQEQEEFDKWFAKKDWIRRAEQFADRYFSGDLKRACYCMKDCNNVKLWNDLSREHKEINWAEIVEENPYFQNANELGAAACSKGSCDII